MTALDTNVIIDLEEGTPQVVEAALRTIEDASERGRIVVCGVVYAELCGRRQDGAARTAEALLGAHVGIDIDLPLEVWTHAGFSYAAYAKRRKAKSGAEPRRILADFIIGAHASAVGALVTSDADFYRRAFPELRIFDVREPVRE